MFSKQSILKASSLLNYDQDTFYVYFENTPQYLTDGCNFASFSQGLQQSLTFFLKILKHIEKHFLGSSQGEIIVQPRVMQHLKGSKVLCHSTSAVTSSTHMHMLAVHPGKHDKLLCIQPQGGQNSLSEQVFVKFIDKNQVSGNYQLILIMHPKEFCLKTASCFEGWAILF